MQDGAEILPPEDDGLTPEQRAELEAAQKAFTQDREQADESQ